MGWTWASILRMLNKHDGLQAHEKHPNRETWPINIWCSS